ncbi:hypothetical protein CJ255_08180 [Candidatus Viridilinea mediisalina]|uniref:Uncharacterized protein n=2 Tax=Candidatus Viridilinea mediisalina TaxID=2024553 RepID=A0A2A6RL51_9CHLR|nr:hypothetical protein CJ255_08180 [Candidatus Viridilinea mediisalina]
MIERRPAPTHYEGAQRGDAAHPPQRVVRETPAAYQGGRMYRAGVERRGRSPHAFSEPWDGADDLYQAHRRADHATGDLLRAEHMLNMQRPLELGRSFERHRSGWLMLIIAVSLMIIFFGLSRNSSTIFYSGMGFGEQQTTALNATLLGAMRPAGDYVLRAPPSLTADQIDRILASYHSPATGTGEIWYNLGLERGIDPAYAVAFFIHESTAGTAQGWAGLKPDGSTTHNVGNIICAGYATCFGRFRDYPSWEVGIADWYRLIDVEYLNGRGHQTVADIIPVYAPAFENDVDGYVHVVQRLVDQWRTYGVP